MPGSTSAGGTLLAASRSVLPAGLSWIDWVHAGVIVAATILVAQVVRRVFVRLLEHDDSERGVAVVIGRFLAYLVVVFGLVYALRVLGISLGPLLGALGVGGIALAFALQDVLQNAVAGLLLQIRRPFRRGHQIKTGDYEGIVTDVTLRTVQLRTYDGLDVYVPNRIVLQSPIVNYTRTPLRRTTLRVGVAYGADLAAARRVMLGAVRTAAGVVASPEPQVWVEAFGDSSVTLTAMFWHPAPTPDMWRVRTEVAIAVKSALDEAGVDIPFPQVTVWQAATPSYPGDDGERPGGPAPAATRGQPLNS